MKINELIRYVKGQKKASPVCAFDDEMICIWINEIEGMVQSEILLLSPADTIVYSLPDDGEKELLVPAPHSKIYRAYVCAMMEFSGGEYSRYDNSMALFNQWWNEYAAWYAMNVDPASGKGEFNGYYVSAYAIAVKHGYKGSEEDWLSELDLRVKAAEKHADDSAAAAASAMVAVTKYPVIGEDGYWKVWDTVSGEYVSTGIKAEGKPGDPFEYEDFTAEQLEALRGKPGINGTKWFSGTTDVSGGGYPVYMIAGAVKGDYHLDVITGDICKAGEKYWEFLCNLKGKDGVVGKNGVDGKDGTDGKSAYEYARAGGYEGSEEEFYDDLGRVHNAGGADLSDDIPLMNGEASPGVSEEVSRADHVHPADTSRMPLDFGGMTSFRGALDDADRLLVRDTSTDETKSCAWSTILSAIKKYVDPIIAEKINEAITNGIVEASYAVSDSNGINYAFLPEGMEDDGVLVLQKDLEAYVPKTDKLTITGVDEDGNTHTWTVYGVKV